MKNKESAANAAKQQVTAKVQAKPGAAPKMTAKVVVFSQHLAGYMVESELAIASASWVHLADGLWVQGWISKSSQIDAEFIPN